MTVKSPQTFEDDIPPIPTLKISKGKESPSGKTAETYGEKAKGQPAQSKPISVDEKKRAGSDESDSKKKTTAKHEKNNPREKPIYDALSTQLRDDLQRKLKRLKNQREETGHQIQTIKQFVEEAIVLGLESDLESQAFSTSEEITNSIKNSHSYSPFRTEVRRDLRRRLKKWKYEREERENSISSIKSFLEMALCQWMALQPESTTSLSAR